MDRRRLRRLKRLHRLAMQLLFFPLIAGDYLRFRSLLKTAAQGRFDPTIAASFPCVFDATKATAFDRHYVYHTAWAARVLRQIAPPHHVDVSSSLYFSSIVSAFIPVHFYDYRPPALSLSDHTSSHADLLALPFADGSIGSLSCMHTLEHVGLGRYGDPLDPDGDLKAAAELQRVVAAGGHLLLVVPVGRPVLRFNAMRVYAYDQVIAMFPKLSLREFSLIHEYEEDGGITANAAPSMADAEDYGCGCFWLVRG
jgi:SAM-dependent methyltransferase